MIENILVIDTETTGLEPAKGAKVIEIAAILFNIKHKNMLQSFSTLLPCEENPVEKINNISVDLTKCRYSLGVTGQILAEMVGNSDAIVAHNAQFDKKFIAASPYNQFFENKKWICTKENFTWPIALPRLRLEDICNGMKIPYVNAHRAMTDILLLSACLSKVDDLQERFDRLI